jgi:hypothetical protein
MPSSPRRLCTTLAVMPLNVKEYREAKVVMGVCTENFIRILAALVTLFSLASSLMHEGSHQAISVSEQRFQPEHEAHEASVLGLLARVADVFTSRG